MNRVVTAGDERTGGADLRRRLLEVFSEVLLVELSSDTDDISRRDTEAWDSFNHLRLAMELEETFRVVLGEEDWAEVTSFREAEALLRRLR